MKPQLKVLHIDASNSFYKIEHFKLGDFWGPVDLGLYFSTQYNSLNFGAGIFAGSILPGSNRLVFTGFSPCWGSFYISSMGGAGLIFDNLGVNMISIRNCAANPSTLILNRTHGEEIQIFLKPIDIDNLWKQKSGGIYGMSEYMLNRYGDQYVNTPRILVTGPAARYTDVGGIASIPILKGKFTFADTWAGRGGLGSKLLQQHGIAAIIYGGTYVDDDFRDRQVADKWFQDRYQMKLKAKDLQSTMKYRYDSKFNTGGTFGVNYASIGGGILAFNYQSIYWDESKRESIHQKFIRDHYLKQFNDEIITPKSMKTCGEPCVAVCKKLYKNYKKDYEPYQAMGPLCGIFDQRAAERLNHYTDKMGFDAISTGGTIAWIMELITKDIIPLKNFGISKRPVFKTDKFNVISDSMTNANVAIEIINCFLDENNLLSLKYGARKMGRRLAKQYGKEIFDCFVISANARNGWMVPNQYWVPGVLSPMAIMGKYYMFYSSEFIPPRELGKLNTDRMIKELILDNLGMCRFHRGWAEEMLPEIIEELFENKEIFLKSIKEIAVRIHSRNVSIFWDSQRNIDFLHQFLIRLQTVKKEKNISLSYWNDRFDQSPKEAAFDFWYEIRKGIDESLFKISTVKE